MWKKIQTFTVDYQKLLHLCYDKATDIIKNMAIILIQIVRMTLDFYVIWQLTCMATFVCLTGSRKYICSVIIWEEDSVFVFFG